MTIDAGIRKLAIVGLGGLLLVLLTLGWRKPAPVHPGSTPAGKTLKVAPQGHRQIHERMAGASQPVVDDDLAQALLGELDASLSSEARRLLGQALLSLDTLHNSIQRVYGESQGSEVAVLQGYGRVLFLNDYHYAVRACPELDADRAAMAYTNALQARLRQEVLALAEEASSAGVGHTRIPASLEDQYARAFSKGMPTGACSNVLEVLGGFDPNPLSTDLFNDAVIFTMSLTELEEMHASILHGFEQVNRLGAAGKTPTLDEIENVDTTGFDLGSVDESVLHQFSPIKAVYREVFACRFSRNHGLDGNRLVAELEKVTVPPTALWIHIQPPP